MSLTPQGQRLVNRLKITVNYIDERVIRYTKNIAENYVPATVRNRVLQGMGVDDGEPVPFSPYSSADHKKKRKSRGLQIGYKDFRFTGHMWNNFTLQETRKTNKGFSLIFAMNKVDAKDGDRKQRAGNKIKLPQLVDAHDRVEIERGTIDHSIMALTDKEVDEIQDALVEEIEEYIYSLFV